MVYLLSNALSGVDIDTSSLQSLATPSESQTIARTTSAPTGTNQTYLNSPTDITTEVGSVFSVISIRFSVDCVTSSGNLKVLIPVAVKGDSDLSLIHNLADAAAQTATNLTDLWTAFQSIPSQLPSITQQKSASQLLSTGQDQKVVDEKTLSPTSLLLTQLESVPSLGLLQEPALGTPSVQSSATLSDSLTVNVDQTFLPTKRSLEMLSPKTKDISISTTGLGASTTMVSTAPWLGQLTNDIEGATSTTNSSTSAMELSTSGTQDGSTSKNTLVLKSSETPLANTSGVTTKKPRLGSSASTR